KSELLYDPRSIALASMCMSRSHRCASMRGLCARKVAGHRRALADHRNAAHLAAVQFDKGAYQRQAESGAAMPRSVGVTLEPVEHLVLDIGRDAGTAIGHGEDDAVFSSPGA